MPRNVEQRRRRNGHPESELPRGHRLARAKVPRRRLHDLGRLGERHRHVLMTGPRNTLRTNGSVLAAFAATLLSAGSLHAATAVVLPAMTPVADCTACPSLHRPDPEAEHQLAMISRELDSVVVGAAQDLGLTIGVTARPAQPLTPISEQSLVEQ